MHLMWLIALILYAQTSGNFGSTVFMFIIYETATAFVAAVAYQTCTLYVLLFADINFTFPSVSGWTWLYDLATTRQLYYYS